MQLQLLNKLLLLLKLAMQLVQEVRTKLSNSNNKIQQWMVMELPSKNKNRIIIKIIITTTVEETATKAMLVPVEKVVHLLHEKENSFLEYIL